MKRVLSLPTDTPRTDRPEGFEDDVCFSLWERSWLAGAELFDQLNERRLHLLVGQMLLRQLDDFVDCELRFGDVREPAIRLILRAAVSQRLGRRVSPVAFGQLGFPFLIAAASVMRLS